MAVEKKTFLYRLKFYGFGFGLGLLVVYFTLLKDRDRPSFMPEGRVIEFFERTDVRISDKLKCELECYDIPLNFMDSTFWANADVDFDKSAVKRDPCPEHCITSTTKEGVKLEVYIENCELCVDCEEEKVATLRSFVKVSQKEKSCDC